MFVTSVVDNRLKHCQLPYSVLATTLNCQPAEESPLIHLKSGDILYYTLSVRFVILHIIGTVCYSFFPIPL